jgi:hypothetical protein
MLHRHALRLASKRRVAWVQDWQTLQKLATGTPNLLESQGEHRFGRSDAGAFVLQHHGAWTFEEQKVLLEVLRLHVIAHPTQHLHTRSIEGVHNLLMVLRFLHDMESCLEDLQQAALQEVRELQEEEEDDDEEPEAASQLHPCRWSALELFCRPWVVTHQGGPPLLCLEEHLDPLLRTLCALCSPWGLPFGSLLAWVTLQSPSAFCRLHVRRIVGPRLAPYRVQLAGSYNVQAEGFGLEALKDMAANPASIREVVKGVLPQLRHKTMT